jgi:hypothetical protein
MTLKSYREKLSEADLREWEDFAKEMKDQEIHGYLNINAQMEEYEICLVIHREIQRRKQGITGM